MAHAIAFLFLIGSVSSSRSLDTPSFRRSQAPGNNNHALTAALEVQVAKGPWKNVDIWVGGGAGSRSFIAAGQIMEALLKSEDVEFVVHISRTKLYRMYIDGTLAGGFNQFLSRVRDKYP